MIYLTLHFNSIEDINTFVKAADKLTTRVDVETPAIVINGRSLLGLCSVAINVPVTVIIEDCPEASEIITMLYAAPFNAKLKTYVE